MRHSVSRACEERAGCRKFLWATFAPLSGFSKDSPVICGEAEGVAVDVGGEAEGISGCRRLDQPVQIVERVQAGVMAIRPDGLNGIRAHPLQADQLEGTRGQWLSGRLVELAHHVPLSLAARTGASPPQSFQPNVMLAAVSPFNGQFLADHLNIRRLHTRTLSGRNRRVHQFSICRAGRAAAAGGEGTTFLRSPNRIGSAE